MPRSPNAPQQESRRIFGLSITEDIEWAFDHATDGRFSAEFTGGRFNIPNGNLPHRPASKKIEIEAEIRKGLIALKRSAPHLFDDVRGIGVSTIGVVNRETLLLENIVRKNWVKRSSEHIIDFGSLFLNPIEGGGLLFPQIKKEKQIVVQNDASARCLTEYMYVKHDVSAPLSLLYLMAGEGINGAVVYKGSLPNMLRHTEMGHCTPHLHPHDVGHDPSRGSAFNPSLSGCPAHKVCFEGLLSSARLRMQWPDERVWSPAHPAWERVSFYLGEMAIMGATALNPELIRFGGALFIGGTGLALIDAVRRQFRRLNNNFLPDYRSEEAIAAFIDRARIGKGAKLLAALTMACLAAFPERQEISVGESSVYH